MLFEVMKSCRNFFPKEYYECKLVISDGIIENLPDSYCRYILIEGSSLNDGVFDKEEMFDDEAFSGCITFLAPPKEFLNLVEEISEWQEKEGKQARGAFQSESFGDYSYSLKTNGNGGSITWKYAFRDRLNQWRKI